MREQDPESDSAPGEGEQELPLLCPNCMTPNPDGAHFCRQCQTPLTGMAETDPLGRVLAMGDTVRKATTRPTRGVIILGMWLIFGPGALLATWFGALGLAAPRADAMQRFSSLLILAMGWLYIAILWKMTRNYVRIQAQRRRRSVSEVQDPGDMQESDDDVA